VSFARAAEHASAGDPVAFPRKVEAVLGSGSLRDEE
jgi:hypothetical protein